MYVDLGVNYEDVKDEDKFIILNNGTYEFTVKTCDNEKSKATQRPMLNWGLEFIDPETGKKTYIHKYTVLPWTKDGQLEVSGVGQLVSICKSLGKPWTGGGIETEDYIGLSGHAEIIQKNKQIKNPSGDGTYIDDPSREQVNDIKKFVY